MAFIDDLKKLFGVNTKPKNDPLANYLSKNNVPISGGDFTRAGFADPTKAGNTSGFTAPSYTAKPTQGLSIVGNQTTPLQQSGLKVSLPKSAGPADLIAQQERARSQDISKGGFTWSSKEDYELDKRKAAKLGYATPEAMRAAEKSKGLQSFQSQQPQQSFDFSKFLSSLNPVRPVSAAELPGTESDVQSLQPGTIAPNPRREDTAALFRGLNPFAQGESFADRLKNITSGIVGKAGQAFNMQDAGVSEWIRGMGAGKKPSTGLQSYESSSALTPRQSMANPQQLQSFMQSGGAPEVLGIDTMGGTPNYGGTQNDLYNPEEVGGEWALLGPELEQNRQQLEERINAGELSGEDAIREQQRYQMELLTPYYEKLNQMAMSGIPTVQANAERQIQRLKENLSTYKDSAQPVLANVENTFGTAIRSAVENSQRAKTGLRNVYSSIGSAESSQFLDRLGDIEKDTGRTTAGYELEKGQKIGAINTSLLDEEKLTNQRISDIDVETQTQIKSIYDRVDLNNLEKVQQIGEIIQNAQDAVAELQATSRDQLMNLDVMDREALVNKQSLLTQGAIDQDSIMQQANLLNGNLQGSIPNIPPEVDSVIRGFLAQPQSGGTKFFQLQALKGRYPELSDLLDQVLGGQVTSQSYNTLGGSQGAGNYNLGF